MNKSVSIPEAALSRYFDQMRIIERAVSAYEKGNVLKRGFFPYAAAYIDLLNRAAVQGKTVTSPEAAQAFDALGEELKGLSKRVAGVFAKVVPTELQNALRRDDADLAFKILKTKGSIQDKLPNGQTPLVYAIRSGSYRIVERCLQEFSINFSIRDRQKLTLFDHAMLTKDPKMIALVLGAAIGKRDIPQSALLRSANPADLQQMETEKQRYRSIPVSGLPPLCQAAYLGELTALNNALANEGVDVNAPFSPLGLTPLHFAALGGHTKAIELLLKNGAKLDCLTVDGKNPLHFAAIKGHAGVLKSLLESAQMNVLDVNVPDAQGKTPLHYAIFSENLDAARLLVQKGADPLIPTMQTTPFAILLHRSKKNSEQRDPLKLAGGTVFNSLVYGSAVGLNSAAEALLSGKKPGAKAQIERIFTPGWNRVSAAWIAHTIGLGASALPAVSNAPFIRSLFGTVGSLAVCGGSYFMYPSVKVGLQAWQLYTVGKAAMEGLKTCWENRHLEILRPLRNAGLHLFNAAAATGGLAYGLAEAMETQGAVAEHARWAGVEREFTLHNILDSEQGKAAWDEYLKVEGDSYNRSTPSEKIAHLKAFKEWNKTRSTQPGTQSANCKVLGKDFCSQYKTHKDCIDSPELTPIVGEDKPRYCPEHARIVFGLADKENPSQAEIKGAYKNLLQYHPDKSGVANTNTFAKITNAYEVLKPPKAP